MSYWTNKITEEYSLIGRPCWYQKSYSTGITASFIKEASVKQTSKGTEAIATLENGIIAIEKCAIRILTENL